MGRKGVSEGEERKGDEQEGGNPAREEKCLGGESGQMWDGEKQRRPRVASGAGERGWAV